MGEGKSRQHTKLSDSLVAHQAGVLPGASARGHLRRRGRRRVKRRAGYNTLHLGRIIPGWPEGIRQRGRIGGWEGDTLCGGEGKGGAVTLAGRKGGLACGWAVHSSQAPGTKGAILEALKDTPVKGLPLDNGSGFAEFQKLEGQPKAPIFFAEPHKPWQRGWNGNAQGASSIFLSP